MVRRDLMGTAGSSSLIAGCRVLFIATGSRGDVQPFLVLAHTLVEAGARPIVAVPRRFDNLAARFDAEFISLDDSILDLQDELVEAGPARTMHSLDRIRPLIWRWLDDLTELAHGEPGRADIVIFTQKVLGGTSVAEGLKVLGLPTQPIPTGPPTSTFWAPFVPVGTPWLLYHASWLLVGATEVPWRRMMAQQQSAHLSPRTSPIFFSRVIASRKILSTWSPHLLTAPPEWRFSQSPPGFWWPHDTRTLPPDVGRPLAAGPPPVVIDFGSMGHDDSTRLARKMTDGLRHAGRRRTLLAEWSELSTSGSGNALVIEEAPLGGLPPRVAVTVHYGRVRTIGAVLHSGTSQVISPFFGDQPSQAGRLRKLGVAPRPLMRITGGALVERLRATDALVDIAGALGEVVADGDGYAVTTVRINQVLSRGESVGSRRYDSYSRME